MKILPSGTVPTFMDGAGIGHDFGQIAAQIRYFDVYYISSPVVGFTVALPPAEEIP
jgi:hypothetical protein